MWTVEYSGYLYYQIIHSEFNQDDYIQKIKVECHVAREEECRSAFNIFTSKPIRRCPLGRPKRKYEDTIIMDHREIYIIREIMVIRLISELL